jgi:hypothetical protein
MFWEIRATHVASECLGVWYLSTEDAPFPGVMLTLVQVTCAVLELCAIVPLAGLTAR